jgi:hypothetical protein
MSFFRIEYINGTSVAYNDEGASCFIDQTHGVLTVYDGKGQRFRISPSGWLSVQDAAPAESDETDIIIG